MLKTNKYLPLLVVLAFMLSACGSSRKALLGPGPVISGTASSKQAQDEAQKKKLAFAQRVADNAAYQQNIVAKMQFNVKAGSKDITVPAQLRMRKNEVIRLQVLVPILGTEIGRLEFTPSYVLLIDRYHKQYVKADYSRVSFLNDNGINFYSLQALFWNQLFLPHEKKVGEARLDRYDVNLNAKGSTMPLTLTDGKMSYSFAADKQTALIDTTTVTYTSDDHGISTLRWTYSDFKTFGSKKFPYTQTAFFSTRATGKKQEASATFSISNINTSADWDANTTPSSSYKQVSVEDVLSAIMKL